MEVNRETTYPEETHNNEHYTPSRKPDFENQFDTSKSHEVKLKLSDAKRENRHEDTLRVKEYQTVFWISDCEVSYHEKKDDQGKEIICFECKPMIMNS